MYFGKKGDLVRIVFLLVIVVGILLLFLNVGGITGGVIGVSSIGHPELDEFSSSSLNVQPNAGVGDSFEGSVPKTSFSTAGGEQLSIQGTIEISDCGTLNLSGEVYELSSDVNTGGTCFSFINDSITLDCKNYQVTYSNGGQGFGVNSTGNYTNLIVRNCKLFDASLGGGSNAHGINFVNALNVTIHNNTIITSDESSHGIFLSNVSFFNITGNNISTSSDLSGGKGIFLNYSLNGSVYLNNITNSQTGAEGIYLNFTNLTTISYNNVTIYADDTAGIYLGDSYLNTVAYNNIINNGTSDTSSYGVYSTSASNADVINNLSFNTIRVGVNGIYLLNSENSTLEGNNINVSVLSSFGIDTSNSDYTKIRSNIISTQGTGIRVQSSSENIVTYNNLSSTASASLGIYLLTVRDSNISFNRVNTTIGNGIKSDFSLSNSIRNNFINISIGNGAGSSFALDLRDGGQTDIFDNELYFTGGTSIGIETFEFTNSNFRTNLIVGNTAQYGLELEATSGNSTFSNNTFLGTYVKTIEDLNITNILIYNNSFGKIKWEAANITTNISLEVGNTIYLQNNLVGLINNVNSLALNKTNKIIQIEIKGLPYIGTPYLFKDGSNCGSFVDPICNITSYDASSGLLTANVSSFSNYSAGDPNPPTFSNASNTSISFKRYENFTANITIDDNISGLSSYIFSTNNSGTWVNDSVVSISGVQYNASVSKNISLAKNNQVCWYYWANDTSSNNLTSTTYCFTVQNTPPSFNESLTAQDAYTGLEFNYDINCSDVDGDNITYYDNTTLFNIDPSTGLINDTSDETEVGAYSIKITCGDDGSNTEQTFTYTINDLNAPTFSNAVNTSANFRRYENFTANITLADGVALDYYLFSTNASGSWVNVSRDINGAQYNASEQANITLAKNNEVCWYYWVNDTAGNEATWLTYCFTVQNTLPSFNESLTAQNAYSEVEFNYDINCSDIDGDSVTYYDNTTLFEINSTTGLINDTPLQAEAGVYFINITCGDGESNTSQTFTYTINDINVPTFSNAVNTSANFRRYENFTANITIDEGLNLSSYTFSTNASGTWQNISNVSISGAQYNASTQANITLAKNNQVCWYYWANDTSSNNATSTTYCFTVQNTIPTHSIPLLNSTNSSTNDTNQNLTAYNQSTVDIDGDSVKNIYNLKVNGTSIIVLNMPFEGINGTTTTNAWDYSGNGNNGSENGGVIWNSSGGYDGKGVYDFDGINDKITTTFGFPELTEITVSTWIKPMESNVITQCTQGGTLFCPIMGSVNNFLWEILNGYLTLFNYNTNTLAWTTASLRNFVDQNWNHAVFTYWSDGSVGNLTFYSNGVYAGSFQSADLNGTFNVSNLIIGDDVSRWWNGSIDEVLIFDRILSAEQVIALYNNRTDLIVSQEISAGDNWSVEITPNDGSEDGAMLESNGVLIQAVPDTTSPTFSNAVNTSANFRRYENFTANITIDNTALDYYIFSSNSSGSWVNVSRDINGAQYNASEQANISLAKNNQICWYYWANDTSSNNATSITYCFTVQNTPPSFNESLTAQTTSSGVEFNYNINCSDIDGDTVIYYDNTTLFDINSTTGLINDTPLQAEAGVYSINITCGDGEVNTSQTFTYTINDITAPSFSNAVNTSANFRRYENFTANITINDSTLDYYIFSTNASGSWVNVSRDINGAQYNASEQANISLAKNNQICW
ncbi:MAG: LamG-like jellyroll fold domain-containing protein, partial [Nanoarchaeota archaeon]